LKSALPIVSVARSAHASFGHQGFRHGGCCSKISVGRGGAVRSALGYHEETDRLNRLVGDLLDMSRIEAGALRLKRIGATWTS